MAIHHTPKMVESVLLHIPHSSMVIPFHYNKNFLISPQQLEQEIIRLTDSYTDELYQLENAVRAVFPVSRFLVDPERFCEDSSEPMAARGMGVIYTVTTDLSSLRLKPTQTERDELLSLYYHPHHNSLNDWAARALLEHGSCLLIDCHSFPSRALPYEMEIKTQPPRPEICIGTDSYHTPDSLREAAVLSFKELGYEVGINVPFAGALVPGRFYGRDNRVSSIMIEIRKDLYMDEASGAKNQDFDKIQVDVSQVLRRISSL